MQSIKVKTPAKINLTLEILNKRPDGFHNIQSIMQAVSLFDFLTINIEDSKENKISISGNSREIPYDSRNIAHKAAELFFEKTGISGKNVDIYIEKHIPVEAGLAGGSSNAAGVLHGLNKIFGLPLSGTELSALAAQIGSDVSFCLFGGAKLASGRGEILERVESADCDIVIVKPDDVSISTKEAYQKFSELEEKPKTNNTLKVFMALNRHEDISPLLLNHFELPILRDYPRIEEIKNLLISSGCKNALMSGSGSSVFGILSDEFSMPEIENAKHFVVKTVKHGVTTQV